MIAAKKAELYDLSGLVRCMKNDQVRGNMTKQEVLTWSILHTIEQARAIKAGHDVHSKIDELMAHHGYKYEENNEWRK